MKKTFCASDVVVKTVGNSSHAIPFPKGRLFPNLDSRILGLLAVSFLLHAILVGKLQTFPIVKRTLTLAEIPEPLKIYIVPPKRSRPHPPIHITQNIPTRSSPGPRTRPSPEEIREQMAIREQAIRRKLDNIGTISVLTSGSAILPNVGVSNVPANGAQSEFDEYLRNQNGLTTVETATGRREIRDAQIDRVGLPGLMEALSASTGPSAGKVGQIVYVKPTIAGPSGGLFRRAGDAVSRIVSMNLRKLQMLYHKLVMHCMAGEGKITVQFTILEDGSTTHARVTDSSMDCPPLEDAILRAISRWEFPPTATGMGETTVTYPLIFQVR